MEINNRETYKEYKKKNADYVDIRTYLHIFQLFIKFLIIKAFEGHDIVLPARLGYIGIRGSKIKPRIDNEGNVKGLAPNWRETKELWNRNPEAKERKELVYCFNEHTNGYRYKLVWFKKNYIFINKNIYSFKLSRENKRTMMKMINKGKEYITIN